MPVEVHIVTPEREVWAGEGTLLVARGVDGKVVILGEHMPMLVQLAVAPMKITRETGDDVVAIVDGGFLHVSTEDGVTRADVLASGAELVGDIDVDAARNRLEELRAADDGSDPEVKRAIDKAAARVALGD
ncbi:MAG: F-type H+-transporting ATPase subunit epsilon [Actinomycetota bacterium]|nr:F-type H+-transporting ATPase subunit epsilon [Actinomycetota bacterium]